MQILLRHFASGHALFTGSALLVLAVVIGTLDRERKHRLLTRMTALIALIVLEMSAAPLPGWFYFIWTALAILWLFLGKSVEEMRARIALAAGAIIVLFAIIAVALELPWYFTPKIRADNYQRVYIVADSITSGVGEKETWPTFYAAQCPVPITDLSRPGETTKSALDVTDKIMSSKALVILEIGGNDMLESASAEEFETNLDALLNAVSQPPRTLVMMELPLLPTKNRFGRIQRQLARKYGVALIPKRYFADVLTGKDATVDGLHLSYAGHEHMAQIMGKLTASAFGVE